MYRLIFLMIAAFFMCAFVQSTGQTVKGDNAKTILWEITGGQCKKPSYLLGTAHLVEVDWLYEFSQTRKVIDSTEFILTEAFSTDVKDVERQPAGKKLKAVDIMTSEQYKMVDSFFVARVSEGISDNPEAENMTVAEMRSAILSTLTMNIQGADGISKFMDLDLFKAFVSRGRQAARLDRIATTEFDSTSIADAKSFFAGTLKLIQGSDKPDWNIYQFKGLDRFNKLYKSMDFDYALDQENTEAGEPVNEFDYVTMKKRNQNWISKIELHMAEKPCLIAVGLNHLRYKTGIISLLRNLGYSVEPVTLTK